LPAVDGEGQMQVRVGDLPVDEPEERLGILAVADHGGAVPDGGDVEQFLDADGGQDSVVEGA